MYGTVGIYKVKPERVDDFKALMDEWDRELRPNIWRGGAALIYQLEADPTTFIASAAAPSKKDYFEIADNPDQDKWFQRVRECLAEDPQWNDGEVIWSSF